MNLDSLFSQLEPEDETALNLMPLIDIIFLLLIFFMLVSTFEKTTKLPIEKVKAGQQNIDVSKEIRIYITDKGQFLYQSNLYDKTNLVAQIKQQFSDFSKQKILIIPDKKGLVEPFVLLISFLKESGFSSVGIGTEKVNTF